MAYGISVPQPGIESGLWQWKPGVLTTRSPGNSQDSFFSFLYCFLSFFYLFFRPYCPDCNVQYTIKKEMRVDTLAFSLITEESTQLSFLLIRKKESEVAQSCPTLCVLVDCSLPGSLIHGILQARILEWVAFSSPGDPPTQRSNPGLPHCRQIPYHLSHQGSQVWW